MIASWVLALAGSLATRSRTATPLTAASLTAASLAATSVAAAVVAASQDGGSTSILLVSGRRAMLGCDAVVHAASLFSLDPRRGAVMQQANPAGAGTVLGAAQRHGLDPVVYVSTMGVCSCRSPPRC
jgi:dihydroflavonol-4-reductase